MFSKKLKDVLLLDRALDWTALTSLAPAWQCAPLHFEPYTSLCAPWFVPRLRDVLFLDMALDSAARTALEGCMGEVCMSCTLTVKP